MQNKRKCVISYFVRCIDPHISFHNPTLKRILAVYATPIHEMSNVHEHLVMMAVRKMP